MPSSSSSVVLEDDLRQLDEYGESVAIRHATAAADRGRTVVVIRSGPRKSHDGHHDNTNHPKDDHDELDCWYICSPTATTTKRQEEEYSLLQTISRIRTNDDDDMSCWCYLVATGVTGDAKYFVSELQTYATRIQHEYGIIPHWEQRIIPYLLRRCFYQSYYDPTMAWNPPVVDDYEQQEPDRKFSYSRPLGIRAVVCAYEKEYRRWSVSSLDPSGILLPIQDNCFVMGKDSKHIRERLLRLFANKADSSMEKSLQLAFDGRPLRLEILHSDGSLERRTIPHISS